MVPLSENTGHGDDSGTYEQAPQSVRSSKWRPFFPWSTDLDEKVLRQIYPGRGSHENPYIVNFSLDDRENALDFSKQRKWAVTLTQALTFFALTFGSSVIASSIPQIAQSFQTSNAVATLSLALYVLGFAVGPTLWAPMCEVYGRSFTFVVSYTIYVVLTIALPFTHNMTALLLLRFLASAFGSSAMINPGSMVSDMFIVKERGLPMSIFAACPSLGPALGPIVGGVVSEKKGWRWVLGVNAIMGGVVWIAAMLTLRETYAPVILRARARALSKRTRETYVSELDAGRGRSPRPLSKELAISLIRPWVLLFYEPIVLLTALYNSIVYATLYLLFAAVPITFRETRGWSPGMAGLPFVGVVIGVCLGVVAVGMDSKEYVRLSAAAASQGRAVMVEVQLRSAMVGSILIPIGMFLFAWTTYPSIHWIAPVIGITIFACGLFMVFISLITYIASCYTIYVASALAANTILRSFLAFAFPMFTSKMYTELGDQWASSIPALLAIGCLPFPFLFYKYGPQIRSKCKYAAESAALLEKMHRRVAAPEHQRRDDAIVSSITKEK